MHRSSEIFVQCSGAFSERRQKMAGDSDSYICLENKIFAIKYLPIIIYLPMHLTLTKSAKWRPRAPAPSSCAPSKDQRINEINAMLRLRSV